MIGYIYMTTNIINDLIYIGKHKSNKFDKSYHGSGKIIKELTKKYGKDIFITTMLCEANTYQELNELEKKYIAQYKEKFPNRLCNIAEGGDGGNVQLGYTPEEKQEFINKMTIINKERCNSEEFKKNKSNYMHNKYLDPKEREIQSKKIRKSWNDKELREKQSNRIKEYYKTHKKDTSYLFKPCYIIINNVRYDFNSQQEMLIFLKENYNYEPSRGTNGSLNKIMNSASTGIPFIPFHYNKYPTLQNGIIASYIDESVQTMGDECSPVGFEISASPKCVAKCIELVQFNKPIDLVQWI